MSVYDEIAEKMGDDEWCKWKEQVLNAKDEIAHFVARYRPGSQNPEVIDWMGGSFNLCLRVMFSDGGPDVMIRFPGLGHSVFRDEKTLNEVEIINFIHENTTIPVPRLLGWGLTKDSPRQLGPFIISEFVQGVSLSNILSDRTDAQKLWLNPKIDTQILDTVYEQIAGFMLQLYQFNFSSIGAISKDAASRSWSVKRRPLTYSMNELATTTFYPIDKFPTTPFNSSSDYFKSLTQSYMTHLRTQRNFCTNPKAAEELYVSRHLFTQLVPKYSINDRGPFKLFCDDFRCQNMLVDPKTLRITAVLDLEFTNAMPEQYASESPWWLLLVGPEAYLSRGRTMAEFKAAYEPRLEQFLRAMQRAERAKGLAINERSLSSLMLESWQTNRFWFNFAARKPIDVEVLFDNCLNEDGAGLESLDKDARAGLSPFVKMKMEQVRAYDRDCKQLL
ncbi:phosphotransferase enzyme family protein-like protein [Lindgomyces ingoldianus]|uniref:Phosphotransferase enzyme family protein-like protein n=1 Tax=Lindgomyces ingoldianus TaxID=673940 RepID=A0ACB6QY87_9PLEO|nr:phosphotransferase enzyme family protein-like protein [Lindgomyces ingoldianus]KAF2471052.1 phosphotransferase enzyme family protein-like protein [Lindgomyces ingoldianus]